jgi:hypothetical protein
LIGVSNNITSTLEYVNIYITILYSIVLYLSVFVKSFQHLQRYEELAERHKTSSTRYNHLYNSLIFLENPDGMELTIKEFELILISSPIVPDFIRKKHNIDYPDIDMQELDIVDTESPHKERLDLAVEYQLRKFKHQSYN